MYWLPIVFVCLANGECGFVVKEASMIHRICEESLAEMKATFDANPAVKAHTGACIQVSVPTI